MTDSATRAALLNSLRRFADEILQTVTRVNILIEQRLNPAIFNYNVALEQASELRVRLLHVLDDTAQRDAWDELELHAIEPLKKIPLGTADTNAATLIEALPLPETST